MPISLTTWNSSDTLSYITLNAKLQEIEDGLNDILDGTEILSAPTISSFANATHDHEDAAGGGLLTIDAINSGAATNGQVIKADGAGGVSWEDVVSSLLNLTDTPSSYSGNGGRPLIVNIAESAVTFQQRCAAIAYHNAAQSIPNTTWTTVALNSELKDTDTMHDNVTNNDRISAPVAGIYLAFASIEWPAGGAGVVRRVKIRWRDVPGATFYDLVLAELSSSAATPMNVAMPVHLKANDYIQMQVYQNTGGALNLNSSSAYSPYMGLVLIAEAS